MSALPPQIPKDKVCPLSSSLPPSLFLQPSLQRLSPVLFSLEHNTNPQADPHKMSQAANHQHATQKVNRFAKRDPALYPLSFIVAGGLCAAGYFLYVTSSLPFFSFFLLAPNRITLIPSMSKTTSGETHTKLMADGVVNPWDNTSKHDTHPS
jgi:hypothetical protein